MKKTVLITLFILLVIAVLGALFVPDKLSLTWIIFTIIDLCILTLLFIYVRHARKTKTLENTKESFRESEQDEILFICKKICEQHKEELGNQLMKEIVKGDPALVDSWAKNYLPQFLRTYVYPAIRSNLSSADINKLIGSADEMNMVAFKTAFDSLDKSKIPDDFLRQLNLD